MSGANRLPEMVRRHEADLLTDWMKEHLAGIGSRPDLVREEELRDQSRRFLGAFRDAVIQDGSDISGPAWTPVREVLTGLSRARARQGFSSSETATFVLSLKQPIFTRLRQELGRDADALADEIWTTTTLLDGLALHTMETFQKGREEIISQQQQEMLELSTPVVQLWEGVLALPLIGTLDSARTQVVMESLLQKIVTPVPPSRSSTSRGCRPSTPWSPSTS
jgi:rsbT co-antagonist protein RsbR